MRADVADFFRSCATLLECLFHGARRALAVWVCGRHVMCIARQTVTTNFRVDACSTTGCGIQRLEYQYTRPLARNHPFSRSVEGLANFGRDRSQLSEPRVSDAGKGIRATRQHQVSTTRSQHVESVGDGVVTCRTGCWDHDVYTGESQLAR